MNLPDDEDFRLDDHLSKCRCCFRVLAEEQKFVKITRTIEQKFFDLTQIELIEDQDFSNIICNLCDNDLQVFTNFRLSLIEKQKKLYNVKHKSDAYAGNSEPSKVLIKTEIEEDEAAAAGEDIFIDCSRFISSSEVKTEIAEPPMMKQVNVENPKKEKRKRRCNFCGLMVINLKPHIMTVHKKLKNFFCDSCPYGAFFKYDLQQHMKVHVKKELQKLFCEMCGLTFGKRTDLSSHMKAKHTIKERVHQCSLCEKSFFSSGNLKKHAESHGGRNKPCEFCGKLFTCMNTLRTHLYYHSEPRFSCDFPNCDKKFYVRKLLVVHLKTHKGQKDIECPFCDKSYFTKTDLTRHVFSIHEKKRFFCQVPTCSSDFSRREYYKKHALAHHQDLGAEGLELLLESIKEAQPCQKS